MSEAKDDCCEEASPMSSCSYIPCNAPAKFVVGWTRRNDAPIRMCAACADHNIRNRGGHIVNEFVKPKGK